MTLAYRIHKTKYPADSGEGAKKFGGRWNPPGVAAIYTAAHASLAILEILVHYNSELPEDYSLTELRIPNSVDIEDGRNDPVIGFFMASNRPTSLDPKALDDNRDTQMFGRQWIGDQRSAVLAVPSAIVWTETNYILNPSHPKFSLIEFSAPRPILLDPRLLKR